MIHIPKAQEVLNRDGSIAVTTSSLSLGNEEEERWRKYCSRTFSQLEWWAVAARNHREVVDPFEESPVFQKAPSERNAP
jgi:chromate reductase